ncbi:MAG: flagellar protein FlgN [Candidatus Latescibacterota bacterium]|nr:flagellar protein FlgN [Candidatus Latescibacterota bacterium]MEE3040412.1 flagellar protein FlgN [Candidatus Latescibacterota bacterium]MEE3263906.1 flagellar protein FlgN [Candidatus Latescibacterota bacterium]
MSEPNNQEGIPLQPLNADEDEQMTTPQASRRLVEVINEEVRVFHELLDCLHCEQQAIVDDDIDAMTATTARKTEYVILAQRLEVERLRLVRMLSEQLEVDAEQADLQKLIAVIDSRHSEDLARMRQVLLDLNGKIRRTNENNAFLIRQSKRYTDRCLDILTGDPSDRGMYGKFGKTVKRTQTPKSVLNRTV